MRYIYCHPLFDELKCAYRFSTMLANTFEKNKRKLERFDYQGTGEAEGNFCDVTIDSFRNDLQKIVHKDKSCLIGTRFGATIAFDFCCQKDSNVSKLILIEPVINGHSYVEYLFRKQHLKDMMTGNGNDFSHEKGFFNLEGYKTNSKFIDQVKKFYLEKIVEKIEVDAVFIVQISTSSNINSEYKLFAEHLKMRGLNFSINIFNLPVFWERVPDGDFTVVTEKIIEWCR